MKFLQLCAIALAILSGNAGFSIDLTAQKIDDAQFVRYTKAKASTDPKTIDLAWATEAAAPQSKADQVYTFSPKVKDSADSKVVFDNTVGQNWSYSANASPPITGTVNIDAANGRGILSNANVNAQEVSYNGHTLKNVNIYQSNTTPKTDNLKVFTQGAATGFALNRDSSTNFFSNLEKNKVKIEEGGRGYFFYLSEKVNQIFFGLPNAFFASEKLEKIKAVSNNAGHWEVPLEASGITLEQVDSLTYSTIENARFDSTTRYIWGPSDLVDSIVNNIKSPEGTALCTDVQQTHHIGMYECNAQSLPPLHITFKNASKDSGKSRKYTLKNYWEKIADGKLRLLIRKSANYEKDIVYAKNAAKKQVVETVKGKKQFKLADTQVPDEKNVLVLGTVFLENVYTYFSYDDHSVSMAEAYKVVPGAKKLDSPSRIWYLVLGTLAALAALAIILGLLTKVPYIEKPLQQIPQSSAVIYQQQPVLYQSYAATVPQQQTYIVSQPQQASPSRIIQQNVPLQYVQSQVQQQY